MLVQAAEMCGDAWLRSCLKVLRGPERVEPD